MSLHVSSVCRSPGRLRRRLQLRAGGSRKRSSRSPQPFVPEGMALPNGHLRPAVFFTQGDGSDGAMYLYRIRGHFYRTITDIRDLDAEPPARGWKCARIEPLAVIVDLIQAECARGL